MGGIQVFTIITAQENLNLCGLFLSVDEQSSHAFRQGKNIMNQTVATVKKCNFDLKKKKYIHVLMLTVALKWQFLN